jgi:hypothetical protein
MSAKITRISSNCGSSTRFLATLRFLTYSAVWLGPTAKLGATKCALVPFYSPLVVVSSLIALPAHATGAIQFRKIQYDTPGATLPVTDTELNPNTQHQEHRHDHSDLDGLDSARPFTPRGLVLSCLV